MDGDPAPEELCFNSANVRINNSSVWKSRKCRKREGKCSFGSDFSCCDTQATQLSGFISWKTKNSLLFNSMPSSVFYPSKVTSIVPKS